jgi:hypothetical protein
VKSADVFALFVWPATTTLPSASVTAAMAEMCRPASGCEAIPSPPPKVKSSSPAAKSVRDSRGSVNRVDRSAVRVRRAWREIPGAVA